MKCYNIANTMGYNMVGFPPIIAYLHGGESAEGLIVLCCNLLGRLWQMLCHKIGKTIAKMYLKLKSAIVT